MAVGRVRRTTRGGAKHFLMASEPLEMPGWCWSLPWPTLTTAMTPSGARKAMSLPGGYPPAYSIGGLPTVALLDHKPREPPDPHRTPPPATTPRLTPSDPDMDDKDGMSSLQDRPCSATRNVSGMGGITGSSPTMDMDPSKIHPTTVAALAGETAPSFVSVRMPLGWTVDVGQAAMTAAPLVAKQGSTPSARSSLQLAPAPVGNKLTAAQAYACLARLGSACYLPASRSWSGKRAIWPSLLTKLLRAAGQFDGSPMGAIPFSEIGWRDQPRLMLHRRTVSASKI